jgi:hypothetical protein
VYDTKLQIIHQYGFSLWEPLLYNGGLMVLGCSCSGEALAATEPLISSPICSSEANEALWCVWAVSACGAQLQSLAWCWAIGLSCVLMFAGACAWLVWAHVGLATAGSCCRMESIGVHISSLVCAQSSLSSTFFSWLLVVEAGSCRAERLQAGWRWFSLIASLLGTWVVGHRLWHASSLCVGLPLPLLYACVVISLCFWSDCG